MPFGGKPYNETAEGGGISHNKYVGQDSTLAWPQTNTGLPVKIAPGGRADLKGDQINDLDTEISFHSRMFRLCDPTDKADFDAVQDKIVNRVAVRLNRRDEWCAEDKHLMVWLEWADLYHVLPGG